MDTKPKNTMPTLEEKLECAVKKIILDEGEPLAINKYQFSENNEIVNAHYVLSRVLAKATSLSHAVSQLIAYGIRHEDPIQRANNKDIVRYLKVSETLAVMEKEIRTVLSFKKL